MPWVIALFLLVSSEQNPLKVKIGRNEVRIYAEAYPLLAGRTIEQIGLLKRLERIGYSRVHQKPTKAGTFFWGHTHVWIYRQAHRWNGSDHDAQIIGLNIAKGGRIIGGIDGRDKRLALTERGELWLEPEIIAESWDARATRIDFDLSTCPESVWRPILAAEDSRFFDHMGVDGRSIARSILANLKSGKVVQGGSTITQQLIKNRDLTPKRTLGRKVSEGVRALSLEAAYDKKDILEAYLDNVYLGHIDGLAIHGLATAARVYFSKDIDQLSLEQSCLLAGMVHGPNLYGPSKDKTRAKERRNWVLSRMLELGWATPEQVERAGKSPVRYKVTKPKRAMAKDYIGWTRASVKADWPKRQKKQRGARVEGTLDTLVQEKAERIVARHLKRLRHASVALVALDAHTGRIIAYVGSHPNRRDDHLDRARQANRQPGSAIKPLVLFAAFEGAGRRVVNPATLVSDAPFTVKWDKQVWEPQNNDKRHHGNVTIRQALTHSYNIPFARLGQWLGPEAIEQTLEPMHLTPPNFLPPSFVLGSHEVSPLELISAYAIFTTPGHYTIPRPYTRIETAKGRRMGRFKRQTQRIGRASSAYLVYDIMGDVVDSGTGQAAIISGFDVHGKTGTSTDRRDSWFIGTADGILTGVWVGRDDNRPLDATTSRTAIPIWREFMRATVYLRPRYEVERPRFVKTAKVNPKTGRRVLGFGNDAKEEIFRKGALPPREKLWNKDAPFVLE